MRRHLLPKVMAVVLVCLVAATIAVAQKTVTVRVTINSKGQGLGNVQVSLALANRGKVSVGTTDSSGNVNGVLDIGNKGKIHVTVVVEKDCSDGQTHVTLVGSGATSGDSGCKDKKTLIPIWLQNGTSVVIDTDAGTVTVTNPGSAAMGTGSMGESGGLAGSIWAGGDLGWSHFPNAHRFCVGEGFTNTGDTCSATKDRFVGGTDGGIRLGQDGKRGGGVKFGASWNQAINFKASSSGGSRTEDATLKFHTVHLIGVYEFPLASDKVQFEVGAGIQWWNLRIDAKQVFTEGASTFTQTRRLEDNSFGPVFEAGLLFKICRICRAGVIYRWYQLRKLNFFSSSSGSGSSSDVNQLNHQILGTLQFRVKSFGQK